MHNIVPYSQAKEALTLKEKVGQLFMPAAFINDTEEEIQQIAYLIKTYHIGGLCFFHSRASAATNYEKKAIKKVVYNEDSFVTLKKLIEHYQNIAKYPLLISIDAEWGLAMRVENTPQYPYAITLGAIQGNETLIFEVAQNIAHDCKQAGIHWNLSPVVDINNNPLNPVIGYRSFGEDKSKVLKKAEAYINGTQSKGILSSIKHFPGHGDTATDSHLGLPLISKSKEILWDNELYPFRELIKKGIDAVMVGHLSVPALSAGISVSATLSKSVIKGVLRKEMGFDGLVISDALNMHSVSKLFNTPGDLEWTAFDAGNDVLCFAEFVAEGISKIIAKATEDQITASFKRFWMLKEKAFLSKEHTGRKLSNPDELNKKIARESITVYKGNEDTLNQFRNSNFIGISLGKRAPNSFFSTIQKEQDFSIHTTSSDTLHSIKTQIKEEEHVLLALFPPSIKPQNNFDISAEEIAFIQELLQTKRVWLYLFGNPYVLHTIDTNMAEGIVLGYQNFKGFQQEAANQFLGKFFAKGKLPVRIHKTES